PARARVGVVRTEGAPARRRVRGAGAVAGIRESAVDPAGARLRYLETGQGPALVHLQPAGQWGLTRAHDLLCQRFRVLAIEVSPDATASAVALALTKLGIGSFDLLGSSRARD